MIAFRFIIFFIYLFGVFIGSLNFLYKPNSSIKKETSISPTKVSPTSIPLTLEEKVGQMFIVGINGTEVDERITTLIHDYHIGGVILFSKNITSEDQVKKLILDLQKISKTPLFISIDQEGDPVTRINFENKYEVTSQSKITSVTEAHDIAQKRGAELARLGINMNFSPVLDFSENKDSFIYERIFSQPYDQIGLYSGIMINTYRDEGIIGVPKHFPGHADAVVDPHHKLPVLKTRWENLQLAPFKHMFDYAQPEVVMVGHILYPEVDSENPTSLSPIFITKILKNELGYDGLVISDDMEMGAMVTNYKTGEAAVKAVQAGVDILLYTKTYEKQVEAIESVKKAVLDGKIKPSQLNKTILQIINLKKKYN